MHIEALMQLFCLTEPWAIGRRDAVTESPETVKKAPIAEFPYFAVRGATDSQFKVVGDDIDECVEQLLLSRPAEIVEVKPPSDPATEAALAAQTTVEGKD